MLRRVLSLLIALPLLLPQGLCVCDLAQSCEACIDESATTEAAPCACKFHAHKAVADEGAGKSSIAKGHTCYQPNPGRHDDHSSECPAKNGTAYWRADIGQPVAILTFDWIVSLPLENFLADDFGTWTVPVVVHQSVRPIYLTTLSLLI